MTEWTVNNKLNAWYQKRYHIKLPKEFETKSEIYFGGSSFSPSALFALAEPGVWFDPSDLTTLFTDPAGTTPVTAPGNTVGLMLDKSKALALGAELVTNGTFDSGIANWTKGVGTTDPISWDSVGQRIKITNDVAYFGNGFQTLSSLTVGKAYLVTATISDNTVDVRVQVGAPGTSLTIPPGGGNARFVFVATNTSHNLTVQHNQNTLGGISYWDNISVRELAGNHATQATLTARPTYSIEPVGGRRNLLTYSEQFDDSIWAKGGGTAPATQYLAPDGTLTAEKFTETAVGGNHAVTRSGTGTAGTTYTYSVHLKYDGRRYVVVDMSDGVTGGCFVYADLVDGVISQAVTKTGSWTALGATMVAVGSDGWYRVSVSGTLGAGGLNPCIWLSNAATGIENPGYTGVSGSGIYLWGAQLEVSAAVTPYQRVGTTQHDVTEAGVASVGYLWFDGVSNNMVTSSVNFTSTNKMTAFAGYRAIEKTGSTMMFELSSVNSNVGSFSLNQGPIAGTTGFGALMNTGSVVGAQTDPLTIPYTSVASLKLDSALVGTANEISLRMNGAVVALPNISGADSGTGNFGNYPFYIGARGGSAFPFKGHIYSIIARGAATDAPTIASTEVWVAGKTGFYTPIITGVPTIGVS